MELEPWLSVEGIADYLGVSKETIYRWLDRKKIPAHRIGKLWKFKPSEVDGWIISGSAENIDGNIKNVSSGFKSYSGEVDQKITKKNQQQNKKQVIGNGIRR